MNFLRCLLLAALALTLSACGGDGSEPAGKSAPSESAIADLDNVLDLRAAFEEDRGKTRVLVLLSPT